MYYPNDNELIELSEMDEATADYQLVLDGTASIYDTDDDSIPRIRGLVELISDFFGD